MAYSIEFRPSARKTLNRLPTQDRIRVAKAIDRLRADPYPPGTKKLKGTDFWRVRAGDYRVVYSVTSSALLVLIIRIGNRREVYRLLE